MLVLFDLIQLPQTRPKLARGLAVMLTLGWGGVCLPALATETVGGGPQAHVHAPAEHQHEHGDNTSSDDGADALTTLQASGRRWAPDPPLQQGMARVGTALDSFERTAADEQAAATLGAETEAAVDHIFANCKLAPAADADLHVVLAELLAGSAALAEGRIVEGHERIKRAHAGYAAVFTVVP
jgi:hypothetical protein